MSLFKTELRRLFKRRLTRYLLILLVLTAAGITTAFAFASQQIGPTQIAAAEAEADANYREQLGNHQETVAACEAAKARGENVDQLYGPDCGKDFGPRPEEFNVEWYLPYQFNFRDEFPIFISVLAGMLALFAFIVGASYVGAEWNSGGMTNLLLWRPKRLSVLLTKLGVLLGSLLGISVVLGALWTAAFWLIGKYDGATGKMTQGVWESLALDGVRSIGLVLAAGAVAFGLASLGRHTAMALGVAVAVGVISEVGLRIAMAVANVRFGDRYVLSTYALAWFQKKWELVDQNSCNFNMGQCEFDTFVVTWQQAALVFGIGTAVVLAAMLWTMRRRDIA